MKKIKKLPETMVSKILNNKEREWWVVLWYKTLMELEKRNLI